MNKQSICSMEQIHPRFAHCYQFVLFHKIVEDLDSFYSFRLWKKGDDLLKKGSLTLLNIYNKLG